MWILKESVLEFKLTYMGERLFINSRIMAVRKAFKAMTKCFIELLKPSNVMDIF